ncbi:MAG TPA: uracil-DNA glycosylase [Ignavibacteria bacterium]|nr:uracil-DNA glycosylase [Ignavibacteria bacterium]
MNKDKIKIINDTINYLKFRTDHNNYDIYKKEIRHSDTTFLTDDIKTNNSIEPEADIEKREKEECIMTKFTVEKMPEPDNETEESIIAKIKPVQQKTKILSNENWMKSITLDTFENEISDCRKCNVLAAGRKQIVFGTGNPNADIVVVGEAPGADENEQGKPFVGRAGKLLTEILKAINFSREEIFICNILKCRPPDNRNPLPDEIENCEPYLFKQLEMIKPKLILAVGTFASQTLLRSKEPLGKLRGKFHTYNGIKMMVTYHPAALLRNPNWKKPTWEDVQLFRKEYDKIVNSFN